MLLTVALKRTALQNLTLDKWLLFFTRFTRLFAYGSLSVVFVLYLNSVGLSESQAGVLLTLTLIGDTLVSLWLTTRADRIAQNWCTFDGCSRSNFCLNRESAVVTDCRHDRSHQPKWQRSRTISIDRTGSTLACCFQSNEDRSLCLVHCRRRYGDRDWFTRGRSVGAALAKNVSDKCRIL
jgi:hypothetical protein